MNEEGLGEESRVSSASHVFDKSTVFKKYFKFPSSVIAYISGTFPNM
jgi:hypothetical protein